jgi:membrane protease YdiL (CAAX protease family)
VVSRMEGKRKYDTSQFFNFARNSYLERTSRPIYAIVFLLPFIVLYEVGTFLINTDVLNQSQVRVVAFVWLQHLLEYFGSSKFAWMAPPLVVVIILVGLQVTSGKRWQFSVGDFLPMAIECILLAVPLIVLSLFLNRPARPQGDIGQFADSATRIQIEATASYSLGGGNSLLLAATGPARGTAKNKSLLADVITGIGAGIYEELIFRLILICLLMLFFQDVLRLTRKSSLILSVLISAALFSAHHHVVFVEGQFGRTAAFDWTEFWFRTIAGVYFAILFAIRGFAITAGTHAFYDIIATIVNAAFFQY